MDYLVCCLYTLAPEDPVFKDLNLKYGILDQGNGGSYFYKNKNFISFANLLNKESIRCFADFLVTPFLYLKKGGSSTFLINEGGELLTQSYKLKKYLRKFHYNYNHYFFYANAYGSKRLSKKEVNSIAIESLLLLLSI